MAVKESKRTVTAYNTVLNITRYLRKTERKVVILHFIAAAFFYYLYVANFRHEVILLNAVIFFGMGVVLVLRRDEDIKIGGVLTLPLLVYYSLSDTFLPIHFFIVVAICTPLGIMLMRRNYYGEMLFYMLALITIPVTTLSYNYLHDFFVTAAFPDLLFLPRASIYILLPHIYIYNLLRLSDKKIVYDLVITVLSLLAGITLWIALITVAYL